MKIKVEQMNKSIFLEFIKRYDFSFFGTMLAIFFIGIINLYSATHSTVNPATDDLYQSQMIWFGISLTVGVAISFLQPKTIFQSAYFLYIINVMLLILTLVIGKQVMGATRWLSLGPIRIQPSEFMKIATVLALGRWFYKFNPEKELGLRDLILPFLLVLFPAGLVIVQPDLGTGLLMILIFFAMAFYRKLMWSSILIIAVAGLVVGGVAYKYGLKEYQRKRIINFIEPGADAKGSGYNAIQSKIAIGSGQIVGKGFKKSSQASLNYLPENHTDFIFSVYNEEHGFLGAVFLITLYLILIFRFIWLASSVNKFYDSIVAIGIMSIFFWHVFINMSMVTGLMPIVGIPLPLMSYGGSNLLTFGLCCGMATSISNARNLFQ
jgi:rod shape determining protein RodA